MKQTNWFFFLVSKNAAKLLLFFYICKFILRKNRSVTCLYQMFFVPLFPIRLLFSTWFPPYSNGCSMDAERVLNGCWKVPSSIVTLIKCLCLYKKNCGWFFSFKFSAKIQNFFCICKFLTSKNATFFKKSRARLHIWKIFRTFAAAIGMYCIEIWKRSRKPIGVRGRDYGSWSSLRWHWRLSPARCISRAVRLSNRRQSSWPRWNCVRRNWRLRRRQSS